MYPKSNLKTVPLTRGGFLFCKGNMKKLTNKSTVILGLPGSYHHQVAIQVLGKNTEIISCSNFDEIFKKVLELDCLGVVATSNSIIGTIADNDEKLTDNQDKFETIEEYSLEIKHCLIAHKKIDVDQIRLIYSHSAALSQCASWLNQHPKIETQVISDTAAAVKKVVKQKIFWQAAIASRFAADFYKAAIIQNNLTPDQKNTTTFKIIQRKGQ